ncbi:hypothetical protein [Flavobacterium sp. DSR2-3-3]|jgi:hypothetical protein|uniref:hypothetical protein n=1 Tax=Flavobacterium sp. DSR2-3-3 TaxID=2804632 RepID=UPI003CF434CA
MKDKEQIFEGFSAELKRNLAARYVKNNNFLNIISVSEEAILFLLVNSILVTRKQGLKNTALPQNSKDLLIEGLSINLRKFMPNDIDNQRIENIVAEYDRRIKEYNIINIVNEHYNELYGNQGGNVIK